MKDYFIRLFDYDRYANLLILEVIRKANDPDKAVKLMAHLLAAQQVWLTRCTGSTTANIILWPDGEPGTFAETIAKNSAGWRNFLASLNEDDFDQPINYKTSKGEEFTNKLSDVLAHAINHGTHHRAQIGQHLLAAGVENLPVTDYIFYLRQI